MFFFQFLKEGGRWEEFVADTPLHYEGNQGSGANNVFGTLFLSILRGHFRYAHINSVRGDGVNPQLLGMDKVVSDDTVRRALALAAPVAFSDAALRSLHPNAPPADTVEPAPAVPQ